MYCEKCGNKIVEGGAFCNKCGTPVGDNSTSQQPSIIDTFTKKMKTLTSNPPPKRQSASKSSFSAMLRNFVLRYGRYIIFVLQIMTGGWILLSMLFETWRTYIVPYFVTVVIAIVLISRSIGFNFKNRKKERHYCPKCRKDTIHNKYGVCTECYLDTSANNIMILFFFLITSVLYVIGGVSSQEEFFGILALISMGLSILYPIYMYPAKLARRSGHVAATAIYVLNLLFGGTIILWIVLLIWASGGNGNKREVIIQAPAEAQRSTQDKFEEIKKLLDMGVITQEEFDEKRKELLSRI